MTEQYISNGDDEYVYYQEPDQRIKRGDRRN
jgi:hypothetical protein